jgi:hypothetical protein
LDKANDSSDVDTVCGAAVFLIFGSKDKKKQPVSLPFLPIL